MSTESQEEAVQRERERQRDHQDEQQLRSVAFTDDGEMSRSFIESMCDASELQDETIEVMQNFLSKTWVLSNLTKAETHDARHLLWVLEIKLLGEHPPEQSINQGKMRAFLKDDPAASLSALSGAERLEIQSFIETLRAQVNRSREGFQQEEFNKQIAVARREQNDESNDDNSGFSLFS